jgi:hypothetical protein
MQQNASYARPALAATPCRALPATQSAARMAQVPHAQMVLLQAV